MEQDFFNFLIETIKLLQNPNISNYVKEKTIKTLLKQSVDIQPNYGQQTRQDLKQLIDLAPNEKFLFDAISTYLSTHNINF